MLSVTLLIVKIIVIFLCHYIKCVYTVYCRLFLAQGYTLEASWSDTPAQKLLARSWTIPENFIKILSFNQSYSKLYSRQTQTDTDTRTHGHKHTDPKTHRQTHALTSKYGHLKYFALFWYPSLHYICCAHSVCEG